MKEKNSRKKVRKFIICFGVIFFLVIGLLTYFSTKIDALLYPVVTAANPYRGSLDPRESTYNYSMPIVPTSSIRDGKLWYVAKNSQGDYYVHSTEVDVVRQTAVRTEIADIDPSISLVICDSNKEIQNGDRVLVKAGVL